MTVLGGRYRLVERLGAGGMAVVWRAYDEVLDRPVAVKVMAPRLAADPDRRWQLRAEAQAAGKLRHPHITNVYDYGEQDEAPYVVMELIDGRSMAAALDEDGPMPWPEAVKACGEVASALATAHAHGVVHRDVKPSNVMLTAAGAKVVDFGISALIGDPETTADGGLLGTPAYLAPERLTGGQVSPATDVYALGLLLYRTLTGHLPWEAATTTQMLRAHRYVEPGPLPPVDGLPDAVALLCRRCLAKQPAMRPSAADAAGVLASVTSPTWAPAVDQAPPRRRRYASASLVAAGLVAVASTVWAGDGQGAARLPGAGAAAAAAPGATRPDATDCRVTYALTRDTGRQFDARITVANTSREPVEKWRLTFAYPGEQKLAPTRTADVRQSGRDVVLQPGSGPAIAPGGAATVTVTGRYDGANPLPTVFAVNGTGCEVLVSGAPQIAPHPPGATTVRAANTGAGDVKPAKGGGKDKGKAGKEQPTKKQPAKNPPRKGSGPK